MDQLHTIFQNLEKKLTQLRKNYLAQREEILILQQENEQLRSTITYKEQQTNFNSTKTEFQLVLKKILPEGEENIKKVLEEYIKQIDQCIEFLEKLN